VHRGRLTDTKERVVMAVVGYGTALPLLLAVVMSHDDEGRRYLFDGVLMTAAAATGILLRSIGTRRD
jgi:hypothetical protein